MSAPPAPSALKPGQAWPLTDAFLSSLEARDWIWQNHPKNFVSHSTLKTGTHVLQCSCRKCPSRLWLVPDGGGLWRVANPHAQTLPDSDCVDAKERPFFPPSVHVKMKGMAACGMTANEILTEMAPELPPETKLHHIQSNIRITRAKAVSIPSVGEVTAQLRQRRDELGMSDKTLPLTYAEGNGTAEKPYRFAATAPTTWTDAKRAGARVIAHDVTFNTVQLAATPNLVIVSLLFSDGRAVIVCACLTSHRDTDTFKWIFDKAIKPHIKAEDLEGLTPCEPECRETWIGWGDGGGKT